MSCCKKKVRGAGCLPLHGFHFLRASRFLFPLSAAFLPSGFFFLSIHLSLLSFGPGCKISRSFSSVALSCQPHRMAITAERVSAARLPSCGARVCQLSFFSQKKGFSQKALHVSSMDPPALESNSHAHHGFVLQEEFCPLEVNLEMNKGVVLRKIRHSAVLFVKQTVRRGTEVCWPGDAQVQHFLYFPKTTGLLESC